MKKTVTKSTRCVVPLVWNVHNRQNYKDRKQIKIGQSRGEMKGWKVMDAKVCESTKSHWMVHYKWLNCMVCKLYLSDIKNEAFIS